MSSFSPEIAATTASAQRPRLLVLTSHAIQYQAPLFRAMAQDPRFRMTVALCSEQGAKPYRDEGFGREVKWDIPLLQGYEYVVLRNLSPLPNPSRVWGLFNPGVVKMVAGRRFDALLIHSWSNLTVWMAVLAAWMSGVPVLLKPEANIHSPTRSWRAGLKRFLLPRLFRRMGFVLASGRYGADFFRHYGVPADRLGIAPYAVDNDFFIERAGALRPQRNAIRASLGLPDDTPLVLFVGKLYPGKRPLDLLQAFASVRQHHAAALMYVGDGEQRAELEALVKSQRVPDVHFAGFRNQSELPELFTAADIFALPSAMETWGLVVNEAMCFSLPIVVSAGVGAGADLVREGENGFIHPVGETAQLSRHLGSLLEDPALRRRMGERSRQIIGSWGYREDLDAIAGALQKVIRFREQAQNRLR